MNILLTGATGQYGRPLYDELVKRGHAVHHAQRHPVKKNDTGWIPCDFHQPAELIAVTRHLFEKGWRVERLVHMVCTRNDDVFDLMTAVRLSATMEVNALAPLQMIHSLHEFDMLSDDFFALVPLDVSVKDDSQVAYACSKNALLGVWESYLPVLKIDGRYVKLSDFEPWVIPHLADRIEVKSDGLIDDLTKKP